MNSISALVADLEDVLNDDDAGERRQNLLRRITGLFIDQAPDLNEEHISVFDEVILCLALEIEFASRIELSERLANLARGPRKTIQNLAHDPEIAVARPVLERSPCLSEDDLALIARERPDVFLAALSRRMSLPAKVTDILLERGDEEVIQRVAENSRQLLSDVGLRLLAERAMADNRLYRILRGRPDLALRHVGAILEAAKRRARSEMQDLTVEPDVLDRALQNGPATIFVNPDIFDLSHGIEAGGQSTIIRPTWPTDQNRILGHIERGETAKALAGIAYLADIPRETVELAFASPHFDSLLFIFRAIGFEWTDFVALLTLKAGGVLPRNVQDQAHTSFHALSTSTAKRVMQFIAARATQKNESGVARTYSKGR
jgi:hypothetical protein